MPFSQTDTINFSLNEKHVLFCFGQNTTGYRITSSLLTIISSAVCTSYYSYHSLSSPYLSYVLQL